MTSPFPGISRCDVENVRRVAQNILGEDVQHIENIDTEENKNVRRVAGVQGLQLRQHIENTDAHIQKTCDSSQV